MLIYIDLLFILNCWIDFLILITTNIIIRKKISYKKIFISSLLGGFSTFTIFISNKIILFILKIIICILMEMIVNGVTSIKSVLEDSIYFYLVGIILAGTLYILKLDNMNIMTYYLLLIIITPIILYISKNKILKLDLFYKDRYDVLLIYKNKKYFFNAFLDTGNKLYDPYKRRPIVLIYSKKIKFDYKDGLLIPIETANYKSLLKCIKVDKLFIDNKEVKNVVVGLSDKKFNIEDVNMILHKDIIGGIRW